MRFSFELDFGRRREGRVSPENPSVPLSDPRVLSIIFGEAADAAGEHVTSETALEVPAFFAGVKFISSAFATLPLSHFKRNAEGEVEKPKNSAVEPLLHDAPNPVWTSYRWRQWAMQMVLTKGRTVAFIERNAAGRPMNIWPLENDKVTIKSTVEANVPTFVYEYKNGDGKTVRYKASEIIDIAFMLEADQTKHISPVAKNARALGLAIALERYAARFFNNGGVPPMQLTGPFKSPQGAERASFDVGNAIKNAKDTGKNVLVLPDGHKLEAIGFEPEKGQLTDARRFQIEEIARMLGLPPVFLQDLTHGTFNNSEQQDLHLVKHTLSQWVEVWEQELNLKLFPNSRRDYVKFNLDAVLRGDFKTRMEGIAKGIQNALLTPNEGRELLERPAMDKGDELMVQGATVPLGQQPLAPPPPQDTPPDNPDGNNKDS